MADDTYYLTTHEAALAVVATAMKKSRLSYFALSISSLLGGILFTAGGMLHTMVQADNPLIFGTNPGMVHLLQGCVYPIGLFYVVLMGTDLFNSNILFFTVGLLRNAVSITDLLTSWFVSWLFNFVGNILVAYVICYYSGIASSAQFTTGSIEIATAKANATFIQTFLKGIGCNFFVCLGIYLQIMAKPIHVKFLMLFLPVFTFVSMGFTHTVADMFLVTMGLINGAPVSVGKFLYKIIVPGTIGNIIGGFIFALSIPWYLHLIVVEADQKLLNLPRYEAKDEQPEQGIDSRVVRRKPSLTNHTTMANTLTATHDDIDDLDGMNPIAIYDTDSNTKLARSPSGVFPVYGMGPPLARERTIASSNDKPISDEKPKTIGDHLKKVFTLRRVNSKDIEKQELSNVDINGNSVLNKRRVSTVSNYSIDSEFGNANANSNVNVTYNPNNNTAIKEDEESNSSKS